MILWFAFVPSSFLMPTAFIILSPSPKEKRIFSTSWSNCLWIMGALWGCFLVKAWVITKQLQEAYVTGWMNEFGVCQAEPTYKPRFAPSWQLQMVLHTFGPGSVKFLAMILFQILRSQFGNDFVPYLDSTGLIPWSTYLHICLTGFASCLVLPQLTPAYSDKTLCYWTSSWILFSHLMKTIRCPLTRRGWD